ncbi:hypothetical protein [Herbaspirillum lusitanum]|nr:hypothetical protein [Herbaspirillum lusitanum]
MVGNLYRAQDEAIELVELAEPRTGKKASDDGPVATVCAGQKK